MTIQEAIKANETRRVRVVGADEWFDPKSMVICDTFTISDIQSEWEAEPEKIEFECKWAVYSSSREYVAPAFPVAKNKEDSAKINSFIGKRTRVTVEVIGE